MCDFEDFPLISRYTRQDAIDDGIVTEVFRWNDKPVMVTTAVRDDYDLDELLIIWHKFLAWKDAEEPRLPVDERLFSIKVDNRKVWVIEDGETCTILYPYDY